MERVGNEPGAEGLVAFFIDPIHFRQLADIVEAPKSSLYFMIRRAKVLADARDFFQDRSVGGVELDEGSRRVLFRSSV